MQRRAAIVRFLRRVVNTSGEFEVVTPRTRLTFAIGATTVLALGSLGLAPPGEAGVGAATTVGLAAQASAIAGRVSSDGAALSNIGEQYLGAVSRYHSDLATLATTDRSLIRITSNIKREKSLVESAAVEAYVASGAENALGLYLSNRPDRTTITNAYLGLATKEVNATIVSLADDEDAKTAAQASQEATTDLAAAALGQTKQARDSALATLVSEQTTLSSVKGKLASLVAAEAAAREREAQAAAAAAATSAAAAAAASSTTIVGTSLPSASGPPAGTAIGSISSSSGPTGSLAADFGAIRNCEASGDYSLNTGNGYYGAYQFAFQTWLDLGESGLPSQASSAVQDAAAYKLYQSGGWSAWPACAAIAGLT